MSFGRRLKEEGIVGSMGGKGDVSDNAAREGFFAALQNGAFGCLEWWKTQAHLKAAIFLTHDLHTNELPSPAVDANSIPTVA